MARIGAICSQCGQSASINSKSITFPRKEEKVTICPVKPLDPTAGNVKSGRPFDCEEEAVVEDALVDWDEMVEVCVNEYAAQIAIMMISGAATFSTLLNLERLTLLNLLTVTDLAF